MSDVPVGTVTKMKQKISEKGVKHYSSMVCHLTTRELYEIGHKVNDDPVFIKAFEKEDKERKSWLKENYKDIISSYKTSKNGKNPSINELNYFKKLCEENDIKVFLDDDNELIKDIYDNNSRTYKKRSENFQKILEAFDSLEELCNYYEVKQSLVLNYGMIFNTDVKDFFKNKQKATVNNMVGEKFLHLPTKEIFDKNLSCILSNSPLFIKLYSSKSGSLRGESYEKIRDYLLEIKSESSSQNVAIYCEKNLKVPYYFWRKVLEEYGINSYAHFNKLLSKINEDVLDLQEDTYENKRKNFISLLNDYSDYFEFAHSYKISEMTLLRYGYIFGISIEDFYRDKNNGKYLINTYQLYSYKNKKPSKLKGEENMEIPVQVQEAVKNNSQEQVEEMENKVTKNESEINEEILKKEFQKKDIEYFNNIKELDKIMLEVFEREYPRLAPAYNREREDYEKLEFNREFKILHFIISKEYPKYSEIFNKNYFNNFLKKNYEKEIEVNDEGHVTHIVGRFNLFSAFNKFLLRECKKIEGKADINKVIDFFAGATNILTREQIETMVAHHYDDTFNFVLDNKNKSNMTNFIRIYLHLYNDRWDENGEPKIYGKKKAAEKKQKAENAKQEEKAAVTKEENNQVEKEEAKEVIATNEVDYNVQVINDEEFHDQYEDSALYFFIENEEDIKDLSAILRFKLKNNEVLALNIRRKEEQ